MLGRELNGTVVGLVEPVSGGFGGAGIEISIGGEFTPFNAFPGEGKFAGKEFQKKHRCGQQVIFPPFHTQTDFYDSKIDFIGQ